MNHNLFGKALDELAIERIQMFADAAVSRDPKGYWVAFSGGKDSCVILDLVKRAGVPFEAHHALTTVDPPELVRFVKTFPEVQIDKPQESMWRLIRRKGMPPRRSARFCCEVLKERGGDRRMVMTGVRWAESNRRSKRRMTEACYRNKGRHFLHPIIDWSTADVWQYIRERGLRYCSLYDEGFRRVGCVLCPMTRDVQRHMARWPRLCAAWERAVKATWKPDPQKRHVFRDADEYWRWWLDRDAPGLTDTPVLFEDDPGRDAHV